MMPPSEEEVVEYTAKVESTMSLDGITKKDFTAALQLSVRKALATEFRVHHNYVTITDISRRRLGELTANLSSKVNFVVTVRTTPAEADQVATKVHWLKHDAPTSAALIDKLNDQVQSDGTAFGIITISVETEAVTTKGLPPPTYIASNGMTRTFTTTTFSLRGEELLGKAGRSAANHLWACQLVAITVGILHVGLASGR
jgi:hypothetical protein